MDSSHNQVDMPRYNPQVVENVKAHFLPNYKDDQCHPKIPVKFQYLYILTNEFYSFYAVPNQHKSTPINLHHPIAFHY